MLPFFHEFALGQTAEDAPAPARARGGSGRGGRGRGPADPDAVRIGMNENPMGPTREGLEAIDKVSPLAWRYHPAGDNNDLQSLVESTESVKSGYATVYPGSGPALADLHPAFTSPARSWVMGSPGYGSGGGGRNGERASKTIQVKLRPDHTHDVEAMIKADPNAGVFYICNPNNPTGTITPRKDLEYILANKLKGSILVIDEAYVHFSGRVNVFSNAPGRTLKRALPRAFDHGFSALLLRGHLPGPDLN